jgi:hypothetical protein
MMTRRADSNAKRPRTSRLRFVLLAVVAGAFLLVPGLILSSHGGHSVRAQDSVVMAIDMDPGTAGVQSCLGDVAVDADVEVDLVIQDVPADPGIEGFQLRLLYDNNIASIQSNDRTPSMLGDSGWDMGDPLPDSSNSYLDGYVGTKTSGSGILTRYTIHAEAAGLTRLHLTVGNADTAYVDGSHVLHLPDEAQDAFLSVGAPCPDDTTDRDSDGVKDLGADGVAFTADDDNCPSASNAGQEDRDADTLGNACDPVVMTIDTDTTARKTQVCRGNVTTGSAVDLMIRSANVEGFQLRLAYDNSVVSFADKDTSRSVLGSSTWEVGGPPDDTSHLFHSYTGTAATVPNDGVLMRYSVNAVGTGLTRLHLINGPDDSGWLDSGLSYYVADQTPDAFLEVGGPCPSDTDDYDSDGFTDYVDTCPNISDPGQADLDGDAIGDACDADMENDGVLNASDNCPRTVNTDQADNDSDGQPGVQPGPNDTFGGDACDPDDDNDGIDDVIDPQSFTFSDNFSDEPGGGTTFGTISSRGGLAVRVRDEAAAGVRIKPSGTGGPANVSVCGLANLFLSAGNETVVTCGSATVQTVSGPVTMQMGSFLRGTLPTGTTVTVQQDGSAIEVCNSASSSTSVTFTGISILPNSCWTDSDADGFFDPTETFMGTNPNLACGAGAWPPDVNDSGTVDISDIPPLKAAFGSSYPDAAYNARVDFNASNNVEIADVAILKRFFLLSCS